MKTIRIASSLKEFCCQKVKTFEIASGRHGVLRGFSNLFSRERLMMQDGEGEISGIVLQKMRERSCILSSSPFLSLSPCVYVCNCLFGDNFNIKEKLEEYYPDSNIVI